MSLRPLPVLMTVTVSLDLMIPWAMAALTPAVAVTPAEKAALEDEQWQWEATLPDKINRMATLLHSEHAYDGGSIVTVLVAQYQYCLCRDRALALYELCQHFGVSCDQPGQQKSQ